jgi:hypothetical protein
MLGTLGDYGLEISQKGGEPGFVMVCDNRSMLIPERVGNHLAIGLQNILRDPRVALAMVRPATDEVLRVSGRATAARRVAAVLFLPWKFATSMQFVAPHFRIVNVGFTIAADMRQVHQWEDYCDE